MDNSIEIWKDIEGYEGMYQVSSMGRVRSLNRYVRRRNGNMMLVKERIIKPFVNRGYIYVTLSKDGKQPNLKVHRLVASAFLKNTFNYPDVNHKDENTANNHVENLEWCSKKYNRSYGTLNARMRATHRANGRKITRYNLDGSVSKVYECTIDAERDGFGRRAIYRCAEGKYRTYKGFVWRFADQPFSLAQNMNMCETRKIAPNGTVVAVYNTIKDAELENGISHGYISSHHKDVVIGGFRYIAN